MSATVRVIAGPARSGKTGALVGRYRAALQEPGFGRALWLAPTARAAEQVRAALLAGELGGCFCPGVFTFKQFAELVLAEAEEPFHSIGRLLKRRIIERLLEEFRAAGRLQHFAPIAETPGLVDLLSALIGDLKRQEIWPERFAEIIERVDPSTKNRELAALYAQYQQWLNDGRLYDAEGRFWWTRHLLECGHWGPFREVKLVAVDGFTDFTPTQHKILQLLAGRVDELLITLPLEQETDRADLFRKSRQTLQELRERHPSLQIESTARPGATEWPAIQHLERHLFRSPRDLAPAADTQRVEVIAASGQLAEMQAIARRIKELLVRGDGDTGRPVRAGDVVVAFHSVEPVAALVQEVFDEYGVPVLIDAAPRLNRSPALAALVGLLRLAVDDWPFRQLLAVLANNYFRPGWPEWKQETAAAATEWAIRELQIPRDRRELLKSIEARAAADSDESDEGHDDLNLARRRERRQRFRTAAAVLARLWKTLAALDRARTLAQWIASLQDLAGETGLLAVAEHEKGPALSRYDAQAWDALKTVLMAEERLDGWLGAAPAKITLEQITRRIVESLSVEPLSVDADESGRVRVLSAQSIRALEAPYLFVAGLAEKSFPPPARDDRIYSDAECRRLNEAGLRFVERRERGCEEMILFYEVITRATRRLTLSYPALDDAAQPLLPSPYLIELERCLGPALRRTSEISLSPVPQGEQVYSAVEERVRAVADLPVNSGRMAAVVHRGSDSQSLVAGLQAIFARTERGFGALEGIVSGKQAQRQLTAKFGSEHCWSVSRLEQYAYCPFRFFMSHVLDVEELPDLALEIDYLDRGLIAHEALAELHRRLNAAGGPCSPQEAGPKRLKTLTDETFAVLFEGVRPGSRLAQALREVNVRQIARWMQDYFEQHDKYDALGGDAARLRPAHFEVSFGLKMAEPGDPLSTEQPFELRCGDETVRLSGRIDRIDVGIVAGQVVFNVVDYKTGLKLKLTQEDIEAGRALQLPLYALAVQELLMIDRRATPWRVGYWYLRNQGFESHTLPQFFDDTDRGLSETDAWRSLRGTLLARVASLVRGARSGQFPVYSLDDQCTGRCAYNTVCRVNQIRSLGKTWFPTAEAPKTESQETAPAEKKVKPKTGKTKDPKQLSLPLGDG